MTAPAAVTAPPAPLVAAPAPVVETPTPVVAPVVDALAVESEPQGMQSVIERITRRDIPAEAVASVDAAPDGTPALTPGDTTPPITDPATAQATPSAMVTEITADEPEGQVMLRARDPKTGQFSEMDSSRTYEMSIKDKQTGETRVYTKTLPELMRMAKDGVAANKSQDELRFYRAKVPEWTQTHQQLEQERNSYKTLALELLTAPEDQVVTRREQYAQELTPEKELARLRQQIAANDQRRAQDAAQAQQTQRQTAVQQHVQALATRIGPVITQVEALVGKQAAAGDLALFTAPLMVNGQVPPEHFGKVEAYIQGPYLAWAQAEAAKRTTQSTEAQRQQQAATDAQRKAQIGARNLATASRPIGGNGPSQGQTAQSKPPARGLQDVINNIVHKPIAQSA